MKTPPDLRSVQKNMWVSEGLALWREDGLKSLQGVELWYCLVFRRVCVRLCVCVCRLIHGEPIIRVSTANSALVLGSAGRLLSHQLWKQHILPFSLFVHALSFFLLLLSSNSHPGLGEKTSPRLKNWALWVKKRWTRVNLRCFCPSTFTTHVTCII